MKAMEFLTTYLVTGLLEGVGIALALWLLGAHVTVVFQ